MHPASKPERSLLLHGAGLAMLGLAWLLGHMLVAIGLGRAGHEPAVAYPLALITFLMASAGVALTAMGPRLFHRVIVADRWLPHVPATFREQKSEDRT
jgi:hypothetical protein